MNHVLLDHELLDLWIMCHEKAQSISESVDKNENTLRASFISTDLEQVYVSWDVGFN